MTSFWKIELPSLLVVATTLSGCAVEPERQPTQAERFDIWAATLQKLAAQVGEEVFLIVNETDCSRNLVERLYDDPLRLHDVSDKNLPKRLIRANESRYPIDPKELPQEYQFLSKDRVEEVVLENSTWQRVGPIKVVASISRPALSSDGTTAMVYYIVQTVFGYPQIGVLILRQDGVSRKEWKVVRDVPLIIA